MEENNKNNYNFKGIQIVTNKNGVRRKQMESVQWMTLFPRCFHAQDNYNYTSAKLMSKGYQNEYREKIWR